MFYFILGIFLGSFLNNVAFRLAREEKFLFNRSRCPHCKKVLNWYELIPIISYVIQGGKCRNCKEKISLRYPLTELIAGIFTYGIAKKTYLLLFFSLENFLTFLFLLFFFSIIFILALYDLETFYISEKILYFGLIGWLIFAFIFSLTKFPEINLFSGANYLISIPSKAYNGKLFPIIDSIFNAFIYSFFFLLIFLITLGKGIGLGDVKVAFLAGLFLKIGDLTFIFILASFIGGLLGIYNIFLRKIFLKEVPFIPFFFSALIISLLFGDFLYGFIFNNLMLKLI